MKAFKKIKVMFAPVFVASAVIVAGNAMASGFGHVDVVKEKDTFLLSEQVRIGTSIYGDDLSGRQGCICCSMRHPIPIMTFSINI